MEILDPTGNLVAWGVLEAGEPAELEIEAAPGGGPYRVRLPMRSLGAFRSRVSGAPWPNTRPGWPWT